MNGVDPAGPGGFADGRDLVGPVVGPGLGQRFAAGGLPTRSYTPHLLPVLREHFAR